MREGLWAISSSGTFQCGWLQLRHTDADERPVPCLRARGALEVGDGEHPSQRRQRHRGQGHVEGEVEVGLGAVGSTPEVNGPTHAETSDGDGGERR